MKLLEALEVLKKNDVETTSGREISLLCGFSPLHLQTFLEAHLRVQFSASHIEIKTGLYGDLAGNLERLQPEGLAVACVVIEWADLDPRLGIRSLGSWRTGDIPDLVESARRQSERLAQLIRRVAERTPLYVTMPTLPLPPLFFTGTSQAHKDEYTLREVAASLAVSILNCGQVKLINPQRLDEVSPFGQRFNPKAEISSGFPYSLEHASKLAEMFTLLIKDEQPRKGLITDLDDTLWAGILGEVGVEGISWDTGSVAHSHGLYQQFLSSLSSAGVLLAVASKNDLGLVEKALARNDILLPRDNVFPVEAHWGPKSESVARILKAWNIAPDDVVFIDDSPLEVAEVQSSFARMECILFPKGDSAGIWELLKQLRDRFGKSTLSSEDEIRLRSIRNSEGFRDVDQPLGIRADNFLRDAEATITFSSKLDGGDTRAFELINKTNQFNLNGGRLDQSEWRNFLQSPGAFILTVTYKDKYGPLGKIAVVMGKYDGLRLHVESWVMSCRAFSRQIEYQCIKHLFDKYGVDEIVFDYRQTPRNGPIRALFEEFLGTPPTPHFSLRNPVFQANSPALFHRVIEDMGD